MNLKTVLSYINYRITAYTEHDVHSPFVFRFYMELIAPKQADAELEALDQLRKRLQTDQRTIEVSDLGAGSKTLRSNKRVIGAIARHGIAQKKQAAFLYRLVQYFAPKTIIELGTSIGLSTLYLAKASPASTLYTIEGCPNLSEFSKRLFEEQRAENIVSMTGNFNDKLPELLSSLETVDLIYIDGNHAYEPTMNYFGMALQKKHAGTVMIFDDIYWSDGMKKAWKDIHTHPEVSLSFDLFQFGIVFFRTEHKNKEHFILKF